MGGGKGAGLALPKCGGLDAAGRGQILLGRLWRFRSNGGVSGTGAEGKIPLGTVQK